MADGSANVSANIRKLRKKLRQIENLEQLDRELTDDEYIKILSKNKIRLELQKLLKEREKLQKEEQKMSQSTKADSTGESANRVTGKKQAAEQGDATSSRSAENKECTDEKMRQTLESVPQNRDVDAPTTPGQNATPSTPTSSATKTNQSSEVSSAPQTDALQPSISLSSTSSTPPASAITSSKSSPVTRSTTTSSMSPKGQGFWKDAKFSVKVLEGHNDLICAVDCWESVVISGSRDTMLKLWDAESGRELRSMGGHTGSVTSVRLLPYMEALATDIPSMSTLHQYLAVTGSKDCSIRLWSLSDGQIRRSIYTYSPVECLDYDKGLTVSGSEGGKIEIWNMETGDNVRSIKGHDDAVTAIKYENGRIVSGSALGVVKIWDVRDGSLHPVFDSSKTRQAGGVSIKRRHIRCLATCGNNVYWGDNGVNLKVLDIASGRMRKIRNHVEDFGSTNAVLSTSTCLISAGYDIDRGNSYLNVRSLPDEGYLATLDDNNTGCVTCLSRTQVNREGVTLQRLCTGGSELKLWSQLPSGRVKKRTRSENEDGFVTSKHIRRYSQPDVTDTESSEDESDDDEYGVDDGDDDDDHEHDGGTSKSWCTIC